MMGVMPADTHPDADGAVLGQAVAAFDGAVERGFEPIRGVAGGEALAVIGATAIGEDGRVWLAVAALLGLRPSSRRRSLRLLVWLGIETVLVNGPLKKVVGRSRPEAPDERPHTIRVQTTSSFPSGHSASSAAMATILSEGSAWAPLWWAIALTIAMSRVHVRDHHASDVLGGLLVGTGMGLLGRRLGPLDVEPPVGCAQPLKASSRRRASSSLSR